MPHSGCACVTLPSTRIVAVTGLRQPTTACNVGEGCTATQCGFILPGMRTCWSDELIDGLNLLSEMFEWLEVP